MPVLLARGCLSSAKSFFLVHQAKKPRPRRPPRIQAWALPKKGGLTLREYSHGTSTTEPAVGSIVPRMRKTPACRCYSALRYRVVNQRWKQRATIAPDCHHELSSLPMTVNHMDRALLPNAETDMSITRIINVSIVIYSTVVTPSSLSSRFKNNRMGTSV